jgi:hypothetical protein
VGGFIKTRKKFLKKLQNPVITTIDISNAKLIQKPYSKLTVSGVVNNIFRIRYAF